MKKKMLHKNQAPGTMLHNVAKWPPSAKTPWALTLS